MNCYRCEATEIRGNHLRIWQSNREQGAVTHTGGGPTEGKSRHSPCTWRTATDFWGCHSQGGVEPKTERAVQCGLGAVTHVTLLAVHKQQADIKRQGGLAEFMAACNEERDMWLTLNSMGCTPLRKVVGPDSDCTTSRMVETAAHPEQLSDCALGCPMPHHWWNPVESTGAS